MCNCCSTQCTIVLNAPASASVISLPESNRIRGGRVRSISTRRLGSATGKASNGATLVSDAVMETAHLKILSANGTEIWEMPLHYLMRDYNSPAPTKCDIRGIDPTQCQITFDTSVSGYAATQVFEIIFELDCNACGTPDNAKV
jgi:hypothetical protein